MKLRNLKPANIGASATGAFLLSNTLLKNIDPRIRSGVFGITGLLLFSLGVFGKENKTLYNIGSGLAIAGLLDLINSFRGGYLLNNKFNGSVFYKSENSDTPRQLKPFENSGFFSLVDGISTPFKKGMVYKVPNGCYVNILENGDIQLSTAISKSISNCRPEGEKAGWYGLDWIKSNPVRESWMELYNASL